MSSPKAARGKSKTTRKKAAAKPARKAAAAKPKPSAETLELSAQASALAAVIERSLADGQSEILTDRALQDLMAALCKTYSAQIEAGHTLMPLRGRTIVSSTDVMTTASGLLKAANLAVFELGMWQSWTGR